jgi:hypothetical protein
LARYCNVTIQGRFVTQLLSADTHMAPSQLHFKGVGANIHTHTIQSSERNHFSQRKYTRRSRRRRYFSTNIFLVRRLLIHKCPVGAMTSTEDVVGSSSSSSFSPSALPSATSRASLHQAPHPEQEMLLPLRCRCRCQPQHHSLHRRLPRQRRLHSRKSRCLGSGSHLTTYTVSVCSPSCARLCGRSRAFWKGSKRRIEGGITPLVDKASSSSYLHVNTNALICSTFLKRNNGLYESEGIQ